jgi:transcriptional regulator with XRE-family HTH domain
MHGDELRQARQDASLTQQDAAVRLGVTQAYLSMVERGKRPVSQELAARAVEAFAMPATSLPLGPYERAMRDELYFKQALGALAYPGFAYLRGGQPANPAALLMEAIDQQDLDARVVEALPWLILTYPALAWQWLSLQAKIHDRQNRLAFLVGVASDVARMRGDDELAERLSEKVQEFEGCRLAAEDTLCQTSMTQAERRWLRTRRSSRALHWNLLSDFSPDEVIHALP